MTGLRKNLWIVAVVYGLVLILMGSVAIAQGMSAKANIQAQLEFEQVTTSGDAELFGVPAGVPVRDVRTAEAQAKVIHLHSLEGSPEVVNGEIVGGIGYAAMERGSAARNTYLSGLTLRNSLYMAVMGFHISDFIVIMGAAMVVLGLGGVLLLAPSLYSAAALTANQTTLEQVIQQRRTA